MEEFAFINVRVPMATKRALDAATSGPYAPNQSSIVRRGIELALKEHQEMGLDKPRQQRKSK